MCAVDSKITVLGCDRIVRWIGMIVLEEPSVSVFSILYPEDAVSRFLETIGLYQPHYLVLLPGRYKSIYFCKITLCSI
jgi:hypothetical protein